MLSMQDAGTCMSLQSKYVLRSMAVLIPGLSFSR